MFKTRLLCLVLCTVFVIAAPAGAADPFAIRTALNTPEHRSATVAMQAGEVLSFTADDLERRMGLSAGSLQGVTVTALPAPEQGGLFLDGVEVEAYEFLLRDDLDRLCFAASDTATGAVVGFAPQGDGGVTTSLTIKILDRANAEPVIDNLTLTTLQNVPVAGRFAASDPDGDAIHIVLAAAPQKGEVQISGLGINYEPYLDKTGADAFTVWAVDEHGAYSRQATVQVEIERYAAGIYYVDMQGNPSQYAAIKLHEHGVITGQKLGASWFFEPHERMTRGEFLVMLLSAAGLEDTITATVNTGLPNDSDIPGWLKKYVRKAVEAGILAPDQPFYHSGVPSRAEAVVLTHRASGIDDVKDYPLDMADSVNIPRWARSSYRDLAAYKMLDLYDDGLALPAEALDNAYAADLVWQLYKHLHR